MNKPTTPIEKYLSHLDNIFQIEPEFFGGDKKGDHPGVTSIVYSELPESGMITGLTYGLSLVEHPDWKLGRPELLISVESTDKSWAQAAGFIAEQLRGDCPFSYSYTVNFGEPISDESEMDAFLVFVPSILDKEFCLNVDIGLDYKINIAGLYPIYSTEMKLVNEWGLEKFWHHPDFDNYNVNRKRITG